MRGVPVMHRRTPDRLEMGVAGTARQQSYSDGCVGRPERRGFTRFERDVASLCHQLDGVDIAGLALLGAHAQRGVALEMLDRAKALAPGELDVAVCNVVLLIDEYLATARQIERRR